MKFKIKGGKFFKAKIGRQKNSSKSKLAPNLDFKGKNWPPKILQFLFHSGYYERLITGQMDFKWSPEDQDKKRHSMATITSSSTPESDSVRTSLADITSHGGVSRTSDRRRRSGSRTSHGSRGKTLRLSIEQKIGISKKEVERMEADLAHFRSNIKQSTQRGAAEIEERALKLREVVKTRENLLREFEDCIEIEHGRKKFNFDRIYATFQKEINDKKRLMGN